jgi:regulation of enolase protein 1 (concanavalin A-like superfamily)
MTFRYANCSPASPSESPAISSTFTLIASAPTDIWRKPPDLDVFTAPIVYQSLPVSSFLRARVTVSGAWKTLYDQGGLLIVLPPKKSSPSPQQKRWVKTGIEFYHGRPFMSVVAADEWADWSLVPLSEVNALQERVTVEIERDREADGTLGSVLRVLMVEENGTQTPVREVTWAFHGVEEEEEMWIGVFAAKPTKSELEELLVKFEGFEIARLE